MQKECKRAGFDYESRPIVRRLLWAAYYWHGNNFDPDKQSIDGLFCSSGYQDQLGVEQRNKTVIVTAEALICSSRWNELEQAGTAGSVPDAAMC